MDNGFGTAANKYYCIGCCHCSAERGESDGCVCVWGGGLIDSYMMSLYCDNKGMQSHDHDCKTLVPLILHTHFESQRFGSIGTVLKGSFQHCSTAAVALLASYRFRYV